MHQKVKHKPIQIQSINMARGNKICDLEGFFLVIQELLQEQVENGKKGKILSPEYKMSYKKARGILFDLHSYFGLKGCFSYGTCDTCERFQNGAYTHGIMGTCGGQEKFWCDACNKHTQETGGFGL